METEPQEGRGSRRGLVLGDVWEDVKTCQACERVEISDACEGDGQADGNCSERYSVVQDDCNSPSAVL